MCMAWHGAQWPNGLLCCLRDKFPGSARESSLGLIGQSFESGRTEIQTVFRATGALVHGFNVNGLSLVGQGNLVAAQLVAVA